MLVTGETNGFGWYEIDKRAFSYTQAFHGDQEAQVVTAICPPGAMPSATLSGMITGTPESVAYRYAHTIGFRLLDDADMPGRLYAYDRYSFRDFDFISWLRDHLAIPENIDFRLDLDVSKARAHAVARTMRNGIMTDVRRKLDPDMTLLAQMPPILKYFDRRCPRVEEGAPALGCGVHIASLLGHVDASSRATIETWAAGSMIEDCRIAGLTLPGAYVDMLTLRKAQHSNAVHAIVDIVGGHRLQDDDTGITVTLSASLPHTLTNGLKDQLLGNVIDIPWLSRLRIRSAGGAANGKVRIRAHGAGAAFELPAARTPDADATRTLLDGLIGRGIGNVGRLGEWMHIDEAVVALLDRLEPHAIGAVLAALAVDHNLDLDPYGLPGWRLKRDGRTISIEDSPTIALTEWLRKVGSHLGD